MTKIPFHLVTGFLGSGKTTFLKNILTQYADRKRIAGGFSSAQTSTQPKHSAFTESYCRCGNTRSNLWWELVYPISRHFVLMV